MKFGTRIGIALGVLAAGVATAGDLAVSAYWQDHMVLQRDKKITVWGKDAAGRTVTVSFAGQSAIATTDANGFWETTFAQPFALSTMPQTLTITNNANEAIAISDVLVGDVFLAAGQSNMDRRLDYNDFHEPQSVKDFCVDDDGIRFIRIARSCENTSAGEQFFDLPPHKAVNDGAGYYGEGFDWAPAIMNGVASNKYHVSSVALNFAHYIRRANAEKNLDIPIGIIHASSGGTFIRNWLTPEVIAEGGFSPVTTDGRYWNTMMAPILRAKVCAVLWYQGCSDSDPSWVDQYKAMMDILVKDRRDRWGENGDLPFYAVQIGAPNYNASSGTIGFDQYPAPNETVIGHNYAPIREHQRLWNMSDTGTHGLVTIVDCVDCLSTGSLHPTDKNFVGRRLSLLARRDIYGETDLQAEGPAFTRAVRESDGSVRIFFKSGTAKGLTAGRMKPASEVALSQWVKKSTDPIRGFAICGANNVWQEAEATVEGETIVLRADSVATPTKFHYGYWTVTRETLLEDGQRLNLYNEAGLPMSPVAPQTVEDADDSTKVADPVLTPGSCLFSPSTNVTIACATSGATVRYTLDGSEPTASSAVYSTPIALTTNTTVKARAFAANKEASDIASATYTLGEPPAPSPNPLWTNGSYEPSAWTPPGENLLADATASHEGSLSGYASADMGKLTDGRIPVDFSSGEVVGLGEDRAAIWTFDEPKSIGTIRISSRWSDTSFDAIMVKEVYVLNGTEWVALGTPNSFKTGLASITTGALMATLSDDGLGYLASNASGLKIVFGKPETGTVANYYAEIEAIAPGGEVQPTEMVATPAFDPASCSFFPSTNVALSCATAGATIYYTTNGTVPTASSTPYTAPIALSATKTIKARAYKEGMTPSGVATATFTLSDPSTPPDDPTVTTNGMWISSSCAPANWTALANNLLAGRTGTISGATAGSSYASSDPDLLTDGSVPEAGGAAWIVGFQNNASISWTFESPVTLEQVRVSCGYLAQAGYSGFTVSAIEVKTFGSTDWTAVSTEAGQMRDTGTADILSLVLADGSGAPLAENIGALRVTFAAPPTGFANYCAEIETVGTTGSVDPSETVASPTFDPASCSFYPSTNVALSCATEGAIIRYTLDGSEPTAESEAYETPIALSATTTIKARAFATNMNPSAIASATYTLAAPTQPGAAWTTSEFSPSAWSPLENNLLLNQTGTLTGNKSYMTSDITKITDGEIPASNAQVSDTFGFAKDATVDWTFEGTNTLEKIRFTTCYVANWGIYDDIKISKIEVKTSESDSWTDLGVEPVDYPGTGTADTALSATLENATAGFLARNVTALRITFGEQNNVAQYYAEIEAVGTAEGVEPTYDITIEAPQNGTLETSATNNVAAGTVVTVTATPAAGYELASVTTNGAALASTTFEMPSEDVTVAATFAEKAAPTHMFYIGDTGYDSWTNAYNAATNGATIVVGANAAIDPLVTAGVLGKSVTIDLNGNTLGVVECWLTGCSVAIVDTGSPAGSGRFEIESSGLNLSGGTLDLSALSGNQVAGHFQMSSTSLLKFPRDLSILDDCTSRITIDTQDTQTPKGKGARILVKDILYIYDGDKWVPYAAIRITSIAVDPDTVEIGVSVELQDGFTGTVTIRGCETLDGTYHDRTDATTRDGVLYSLPVTDDRFFQAALVVQENQD